MKKLLLLFCLMPFMGYSQLCIKDCKLQFENDPGDYIVKEYDGVELERLYTDAKNFIVSSFKSPEKVLSESGEILSINGVSNCDSYIKYMGTKIGLIVDYTLVLRFKDGKIRVDAPHINDITTDTNPVQVAYMEKGNNKMRTFYLYKKNGELRYKDFEPTLLNYFNGFINELFESIGKTEEDW